MLWGVLGWFLSVNLRFQWSLVTPGSLSVVSSWCLRDGSSNPDTLGASAGITLEHLTLSCPGIPGNRSQYVVRFIFVNLNRAFLVNRADCLWDCLLNRGSPICLPLRLPLIESKKLR
jgi:hypothetical protein